MLRLLDTARGTAGLCRALVLETSGRNDSEVINLGEGSKKVAPSADLPSFAQNIVRWNTSFLSLLYTHYRK